MKKTAIVTGGSSRRIGYGIVRQLGLDGYRITILDVNNPRDYKDSLEELNGLNRLLYVQEAPRHREDRRCFCKNSRKYGDIDVRVNNAGVAQKCARMR